MRLWIDDVRPAPKGYLWVKTVKDAKAIICCFEQGIKDLLDEYNFSSAELWDKTIEVIDIDHDAGEFGPPDYIKILDWLEETGRNYPIHIHSMNPVGIQNMRAIIQKNGWIEI